MFRLVSLYKTFTDSLPFYSLFWLVCTSNNFLSKTVVNASSSDTEYLSRKTWMYNLSNQTVVLVLLVCVSNLQLVVYLSKIYQTFESAFNRINVINGTGSRFTDYRLTHNIYNINILNSKFETTNTNINVNQTTMIISNEYILHKIQLNVQYK